jgi:hypothetical protein
MNEYTDWAHPHTQDHFSYVMFYVFQYYFVFYVFYFPKKDCLIFTDTISAQFPQLEDAVARGSWCDSLAWSRPLVSRS